MAIIRIYKLVNSVDEYIYIGSTTCLLNERFDQHIKSANSGSKAKLYKHMRLIGIDKFIMQLIEKVVIKTKEEYEQDAIDKANPNFLLNTKEAAIKRNYEEDYNKQYQSKYYQDNKEKRVQYQAEYRQKKRQQKSEAIEVVQPIIEKLIDQIFDMKI